MVLKPPDSIVSEQPRYPHNRKVIYNIVLVGTCTATTAISILLLVNLALNHNTQTISSLLVCLAAFLYIGLTHWFARRNRYRVAAYLLIAFYTMLATGIVWVWGINTPLGLLIFGLAIVLAGILLTARHALFAALLASFMLLFAQATIALGWHTPELDCACDVSSFYDVIAYCTVYGMLSLITWLYNREIERSLQHAYQAEAALMQQKATLEIQVKKRTAELRQAQIEEMRQMYRFAELGQLGVALLHDLANHLTVLTLEIDSLQSREHAKAIAPARRIISYLDSVVDSTRQRLHGKTQKHTFNLIQKTTEALAFLHYKAAKANVTIDWQPSGRKWQYKGDPASLSQIIALIVSNAIDSYDATHTGDRRVAVTMQKTKAHIIIKVSDWGKGIPKNKRRLLFKPFTSSKRMGLGLGLFIARQSLESHFSGSIALNPRTKHTEFVIKLPLENGK